MMYMTYQHAQIRCDELVEQAARHRLARRVAMTERPSRRSRHHLLPRGIRP